METDQWAFGAGVVEDGTPTRRLRTDMTAEKRAAVIRSRDRLNDEQAEQLAVAQGQRAVQNSFGENLELVA